MNKLTSLLTSYFALILVSFCSCTTYSNFTADAPTRRQMLNQDIGKFHRFTTRGQFDMAIRMVSPEAQADFIAKQEREKKKERVVEKEIEDVEFNSDSNEATVSVLVRYFKQPAYVVMERKEEEVWAYDTTEGWKWVKAEKVASEGDKPSTLQGSL